jgi:hypothetical protein
MKATTARMLPSREYVRDGSSTTAGFGGSLSSGAGDVLEIVIVSQGVGSRPNQ